MDEINGRIQLPYGFLENEDEKKINLNLPRNFKKELLFENLPFVAQLNNPAIENVVSGKDSDDLSIQKFLLAIGLLEDSIQNNLDMIVTDGEFNNAGVRRALDQKYPTIMGKPMATSFMFKEKAKFDIQNPIIGTLYNEILTNKQREKKKIETIGKAPSITDLNIRKRLENLRKFDQGIDDDDNDDNDDDNNNNNRGNRGNNNATDPFALLPEPPPPPPSPGLLTPPATPATPSVKKFLLDESPSSGSERVAVLDSETPTSSKTVSFSDTLQKVFPNVKRELIPLKTISEEDETQDFDITESAVITNRSEAISLEFFEAGGNFQKLFENATKNVGVLSRPNEEFLRYLSSNFGKFLLAKNKMKIHLESGKIFLDNKSTTESLYDFLKNQEDDTKKELTIDIPIQSDFNKYVREILSEIVDDDYDLQTNSTSKFLFYNFNNVRAHIESKTPYKIKHSEIIANEEGLKAIQNYNWQYFIETILRISDNERLLERDSFKDDEAFEDYLIIEKTQENLKYCKEFYNGVYDDLGHFFQRKIHEIPDEHIEKMEDDLANHRIYFKSIKKFENSAELINVFSDFYFKMGRFPGVHQLLNVPPVINPSFIEKHDRLSSFDINEKFKNTTCYGIASVQFMSALNVFFGGDKNLSQNVMSEFLHNLSLQALTIDDDKWEMQFYEVEELSRNLKMLMRDYTRYDIEVDEDEIFEKRFREKKDKMQKIQDEINTREKNKLEYPNKNFGSFPNTAEEIIQRSNRGKTFREKNEESLNERDEEISRDLLLQSQKRLIESVTDNSDTLSENEISNISSASLPKVDLKENTVEERLQENIKKDNAKFLKRSSVSLKITPPRRSSRIANEKPYKKEK